MDGPIALIEGISVMIKGILLNFGKRYEDDFRVIFDQWPKFTFSFRCAKPQTDVTTNRSITTAVTFQNQ